LITVSLTKTQKFQLYNSSFIVNQYFTGFVSNDQYANHRKFLQQLLKPRDLSVFSILCHL